MTIHAHDHNNNALLVQYGTRSHKQESRRRRPELEFTQNNPAVGNDNDHNKSYSNNNTSTSPLSSFTDDNNCNDQQLQ